MISNQRETFAKIEWIRFAFRVMPVESFSCCLGTFFKMVFDVEPIQEKCREVERESRVGGRSGFLNQSALETSLSVGCSSCYPCRTLDPVALQSHQLYDLAPLHGQTCQKAFVESGRRL
ncbi:hypothetical protein Tco_0208808 [Tanacetum coccineum]